jgi:very-short-patch-repair endonuclease
MKYTTEIFKEKATLKYSDIYNYSLVNYIDSKTKVDIICPKHGKFYQTPHNHLNGRGCPKCSESRGEKEVRLFLEKNNIKYQREKKFKNCKNKYLLPFDFYLPDKNILIEYDGMQHFRVNEYFGGEIGFKATQKNDKIKNTYANEKNIKLLRISYWENVENKLNKEFIR